MRQILLMSVCAASLMLVSGSAFAQSNPDRKDEPKTERSQQAKPEAQERAQKEHGQAPSEHRAAEQNASKGAAERDRAEERERGQNAAQHENRAGEARDRKESAEEHRKQNTEDSKKQSADENRKGQTESTRKSANEERQPEAGKPGEKQGAMKDERSGQHAQGNQQGNQQINQGASANQANRDDESRRGNRAENNRLPQEKVSRMSTTMSRERLAPPERDVNFAVSIGARVPERVHFYSLPPEIISIEPEYRGYEYFATGDDYVIVDPRSHVVVNTIPRDVSNAQASSSGGSAGGSSYAAGGSTGGSSYAAGGSTSGGSSDGQCQIQRNDATVGAAGSGNTLSLSVRGNCQITISPQ
jgi:hypothetical protein